MGEGASGTSEILGTLEILETLENLDTSIPAQTAHIDIAQIGFNSIQLSLTE